MNLSLRIAQRYLFSKKSHSAISLISIISVCGIAVATIALVCALSVFNGFTSIVEKSFNSFDPDLQIVALQGKVFNTATIDLDKIRNTEGIELISETLEENALLKYSDRERPILLKGVSEQFVELANVRDLLIDGQFQIRTGDIDYGVLGATLAYELGVRPGYLNPLEIYVPKRDVAINMINPATSFNKSNTFLAGVFSLNQAKYDEQMFIVSINLVRELLNYSNEVSAIDIKIKEGTSTSSVQSEIKSIIGEKYAVRNRFEQQADLYKMVNLEKWITFLIIIIISSIAIFNVVGSLSMLIIEKKEDIAILRSMGASKKLTERIFLYEGWLIILLGAISGLIIGLIICLVQQYFGIIKLGNSSGAFLVDAYPVAVQGFDILLVFCTICAVGLLAVFYPIYNLRKTQ